MSGWPRDMNSWGSYSGDCHCRECSAIEPDHCNECDGSGKLEDGKACDICGTKPIVSHQNNPLSDVLREALAKINT